MCTEFPPPGWELLLGWLSEEKGKKRKVNFFLESFPFFCRYRYIARRWVSSPIPKSKTSDEAPPIEKLLREHIKYAFEKG